MAYKICEPCKRGIHLWCNERLEGGIECSCQNEVCREVRLDGREN